MPIVLLMNRLGSIIHPELQHRLARSDKSRMNIYFIEDDHNLFEDVKKALEECLDKVAVVQYIPDELLSGDFRPDSSDLILFDLDCANVNTISLFGEIQRRTKIPIVILDDIRISSGRMIKALQLGASDYLFKPILNSHLISTVIAHSGEEGKGWRILSASGS